MISSIVSRANAAVLALAGVGMLFMPEEVLGRLAAGFPASATWVGQLLGAAWLAIAALNWLQKSVVIGGIYARPLVYTNFVLWLVSALTLVRLMRSAHGDVVVWILAAIAVVFAAVYAALLLRGPFDPISGPDASS